MVDRDCAADAPKVAELVDTVARDVAAPAAEQTDREARWPEEALRALQDAGLGGLVVPERDGGLGHGMAVLADTCERLARACSSTALCFGMHCVGSAVLASKATEEQRVRYLGPIAEGRHLTTLTLSEPGTGSHFWVPQTTLQRTDHGYVVNGAKTFVTNGGRADSYVVSTVAADENAPPGEFSCVVVDREAPGLDWGPEWDGLGMRGNSSRSVDLRDVHLGPVGLLGEPGDQIWYVFQVVAPYFLVAMAGTYLGIAAAAFDEARLHVTQRRYAHDGSRLAEQHVIQHHVGELWAVLERTRQLLQHAARLGDAGSPDALPALASAKAEVAAAAVEVVNGSMSLVGGIGYRDHGDFGRRLRDVRAAHVMAPTTDLLRLWTGRALLGEHLLAD